MFIVMIPTTLPSSNPRHLVARLLDLLVSGLVTP